MTERGTEKEKSEDDEGSALHHAHSLTGCSCYLHSSPHLGKEPSLPLLSTLGSFAQAQERTASLSEAGLCLKAQLVS